MKNDNNGAFKHIFSSGWISGYLYAKKKRLSGTEVLIMHKKAMEDYDDIYGESKTMQKKVKTMQIDSPKKQKIQIKQYGVKSGKTIEI